MSAQLQPAGHESAVEVASDLQQTSALLRTTCGRIASAGLQLLRGATAAWAGLNGGHSLPLLRQRKRRLRLSETLSLGDKRFVSIIEVDGQSFLLGGSSGNLCLLASLAANAALPFEHVLQNAQQRDAAQ